MFIKSLEFKSFRWLNKEGISATIYAEFLGGNSKKEGC